MDDKPSPLEVRASTLISRFYFIAFFTKYLILSRFFQAVCCLAGFWLLWRGQALWGLIIVIQVPILIDHFLKVRTSKKFPRRCQKAMAGFRNFDSAEQEDVKPLLNQLENYLRRLNLKEAVLLDEIAEELEWRLAKICAWSFHSDLRVHLSFRQRKLGAAFRK